MRLDLVTIVVAEYDPAIHFFTRVLGFDLVEDSPSLTNDGRPKRWVVVRPPGASDAVIARRARRDRSRAGGRTVGGVGLTTGLGAGVEPVDRSDDDRRERSVRLLVSTMRQLRIGRELGRTPFPLQRWQRRFRREQAREAKAGRAGSGWFGDRRIPGGELPPPYPLDWHATDSPRLFQERYWFRANVPGGSRWRWRTVGYHWDVRTVGRTRIDVGDGTYFTATVNDQEQVEFRTPGPGGSHRVFPGDQDGWYALMAMINYQHLDDPGKPILLWTPSFVDPW